MLTIGDFSWTTEERCEFLCQGEVDCISAGYNDADLWVLVCGKFDECLDESINFRVVWTKAHTTLEEKAKNDPLGIGRWPGRPIRRRASQPRLEPLKMVLRWPNEFAKDALPTRRMCTQLSDSQPP